MIKPPHSLSLLVPVWLALSQCALLDCPAGQELGAIACVCSSTLEAPVDGLCVDDVCGPDGCPCTLDGIEAAIARGGSQVLQCDETSPPVTTSATIVIDNAVTLDGQGYLVVQGNSGHLMFEVEAVEAELIGTTVSRGRQGVRVSAGATLTLRRSTVMDNTSTSSAGGGIYNAGTLILVDTTIKGNIVQTGPGGGGGIYNARDGVLTLTNCVVIRNVAESGPGGGIQNFEGMLSITDTEVAENNAPEGDGGGVSNDDGTVTISGGMIRGNTTRWFGGGIAMRGVSSMIEITDTIISENRSTAFRHGGGIRAQHGTVSATRTTWSGNESSNDGGGIVVEGDNAVLTLVDSTVSENTAGGVGGGIRLYENAFGSIINSTIYENSASDGGALHLAFGASAEVRSCTISKNDDVSRLGIPISERTSASITHDGNTLTFIQTLVEDTCVPLSVITTLDYNIESPEDTCQFSGTNDLVNVTSTALNLADQLQENGAQTQTLMPAPPSVAIDHGATTCDQARDQRGVPRPQGLKCDIGAVEVE